MSKSYLQYLNYNLLFTNIFPFHQKAKKDYKGNIIAKKRETFPTNKPFI